MKKKNRILSGFLSVMLLCSVFSPYVYADNTKDKQNTNSELTPEDLHFRKYFTGRNLFDSEIPISNLDLESASGEDIQYTDGRLVFQNNGEQNSESKLQLADSLTPYSMYDLGVTRQNFSDNGASVAEILWEKDGNNSISVKRAAVPEKEPEIVQGELLESLDLNDEQILENHTISSEVSPRCEFTNGPGWLKVASGGNGTGEAYLHVGKIVQNSYMDISVSEQIKKDYTANALVKLRQPSASGKNNGIFICQRANGTMTAEILIDGVSKRFVTISDQGVEAPYDFRVAVVGNEIQISRFKDGKVSAEGTLDVTGIYDLMNPDVLEDFEYVIGGRLAAGESVTFTKADIYQLPEQEKELSSLDMSDPDLLEKVDVYHDFVPYNSAEKVAGGIKLKANGDRGESYINAGALQQDTVLEAAISEQVVSGYTASAILKFRDKSFNNAKSNGIYLTQRAAAAGNKTYGLEVIVNGVSVKNIAVAANAVSYPFKLRMALHGNIVVASRVVDGKEQGFAELDVSEWFDLKDPEVLKNFEATAGAKLGNNESMTYSDISIKKHARKDDSALPTEDNGIILQVKKDGSMVLNKVINYPSKLLMGEPYTLRTHWAGQYLCIWIVRDGKPYLLSAEDLGAYFDMRISDVYSGFKPYMKASLAPGAELEADVFRNYYTGGDGQADPKPLHYKDGTVMVEDGKMWISMTLRGYQPLPASCQAIYSFDLQTYELKLVNITTFKKPGDNREWAYHASDFCYDEDADQWIVVTSSHGDDKLLRAGILPADPRTTPYLSADVDVLKYEAGARSNYEDPSIIYDKEAGKWRIATCFSGSGGFNVGLIEADNFNGPYHEIAAYGSGSCTGILIQKVGGKYYVFTGRSPGGNGVGAMNLEALNYPEMTKNTSLNVDGQTDSYNPWPMIFPLENEKGETVYRLLSFDRDTIMANDGSMAGGQYSYGRIYLYEALEKFHSKDVVVDKPVVSAEPAELINTPEELWAVSKKLDGNYKLGSDIDLSNTDWYPIGDASAPFTGTFDGNGFKIIGLHTVGTQGMDGIGLFGYTAESAELTNVLLSDVDVVGRIYTGGLVGFNKGTVANCAVSGIVEGESETGLIVGRNAGRIANSVAKGQAKGNGNDSTGGLAGANSTGEINECYAEAEVTGTVNVGGLVGYNDRASIQNAYANGTVKGKNYVGGLVGASGASGYTRECSIVNSYADSTVEGNTAGTLVGFNDKNISGSFGLGTVKGSFAVGGLAGRNNQYGNVKNCYTNAETTGDTYVGKLFGKNMGDFENVACSAGDIAIGNSTAAVISSQVPDFTQKEVYTDGALADWDEAVWKTGDGYPSLIHVPEIDTATQTYKINIAAMQNGTVTSDKDQAQRGETVTLTVKPSKDYQLKEGSLKVNGTEVRNNKFIMPEKDVTVTAEFEKIRKEYTITIASVENGTVTANVRKAYPGDEITLTVKPSKDYQLKEGSLKVNGTVVRDNKFIMPEKDVTVTAEFEKIRKEYTIIIDAMENGTVTASAEKAYAGDEITLTVKPSEDYQLKEGSLQANGTEVKDNKFIMPEKDVTVTAEFERIQSDKKVEDIFDDIDAVSWYKEYVQYVYDKNIMKGMTETIFGSDVILTRSHFATMLYRMEGEPEVEYRDQFGDVPKGEFYTSPVMWASAEDVRVISGYESGDFGPNDDITREQIAVMLYRYAQYKEYDVSNTNNLNEFTDHDKVSDFAEDAMEWAVAADLIKGEGDDKQLNPQGGTSRAVCATIMQRFLERFDSDK